MKGEGVLRRENIEVFSLRVFNNSTFRFKNLRTSRWD